MNFKVKVCGMKYPENILEVAACGPDLMGFIFYEKSKRYVGEDFDPELLKKLNPSIIKTGVFVNHSVEYIEDKIKKYDLSLLQLHGDESVEQCQALKTKGYKISKVFQVDKNFDFISTEPYKKYVDYFLFDTKSEGYGGTGKKFDWSLIKKVQIPKPFFLSGGIGPEEADELKVFNHPQLFAIDINSRFEIEPGVKNIPIVTEFIKKIHSF